MLNNTLYCIYGMCIMFYSMMACFFWRKNKEVLSRLIVALTSLIAVQCFKDLFFIDDFFSQSLYVWKAVTLFDMMAVPLYGAILKELFSGGELKAVHIIYHEIPFLILPILFFLTGNDIFFDVCVAFAVIYGSYYAVWTLIAIPRYNRQLKEKFSYTENIDLRWVRTIMLSFFAVLGLYVIDSINASVWLECLYMLGALVLWMFICYFLYRHESIINELAGNESAVTAPISHEPDDELTRRIEQMFAVDKIYLNPSLKLSDVASLALTNRTYISRYFNQSKDSSFYTYVNRYRIDHACHLLKTTNDTIEIVAEQSGFNSKATFYRVFSDMMGCSPSKYRQGKM